MGLIIGAGSRVPPSRPSRAAPAGAAILYRFDFRHTRRGPHCALALDWPLPRHTLPHTGHSITAPAGSSAPSHVPRPHGLGHDRGPRARDDCRNADCALSEPRGGRERERPPPELCRASCRAPRVPAYVRSSRRRRDAVPQARRAVAPEHPAEWGPRALPMQTCTIGADRCPRTSYGCVYGRIYMTYERVAERESTGKKRFVRSKERSCE